VRVLVVVLLAASVIIGARAAPPARAASEQMDVVELALVDTGRETPAIGLYPSSPRRELPTTVYLPPVAGPAPLILLAHGFDGHPRKFSELATHWAAAGYVVAVPRFPVTNDEFAVTDPGVFGERVADMPEQARDVSFVIDEVLLRNAQPASGLSERVDPDRIGLFGLSLGSLTVWTAVLGDGFGEDRADALMQSDGAFPGDLAELATVEFPVFVAHSDVDTTFDAARVVMPQFAALPAPKFMLVLHGAVHAAVGENTPTPADEAYRIATTAFWDRYVGGHAETDFPPCIEIEGVTTFIAVER
jgi:dienelactone hydrolase